MPLRTPDYPNGLKATLRGFYEIAKKKPRPNSVLAAFEALAILSGYWKGFDQSKPRRQPDPTAMVMVPYWVVETLGGGWVYYMERAPSAQNLGESFRIEGGGQEKSPAKEGWKRFRRDLWLVLMVKEKKDAANQEGERLSFEEAFAEVAELSGHGVDIVKRAWLKRRGQITN